MGELIRREAAATPLTFSGERLTAAISGQVEIEHYHRYLLAREFCRGKDALDVAAGEGYGTALLAQVARSAVGIEIDAASVEAARNEFQRPNLRYEQGDARQLKLDTASIDVAVSFETLEHLGEQDQFLSELRRVLRPGGLLIISTPDRDTYSPVGVAPNPFHVLELTQPEFEALLARHFEHSAIAAQRALIGSVILGASQDGKLLSYERRSDAIIEGSTQLSRAPYMVAFASDAPLPTLPGSVYVYRSDIDTDPQVRREAEIGRREAEQQVSVSAERAERAEAGMAIAQQQLMVLQQEAAERGNLADRQIVALRQASVQATSELEETRRRAEVAEAQAAQIGLRLNSIETSSIWRATAPLRSVGSRFPLLSRTVRRTVKLLWWTITLQLPRRLRSRHTPPGIALEAASVPPVKLMEPSAIRLPCATVPMVSVIISTYGQRDATLSCLRSISDNPPAYPIEVILVNDAYPGPEDMSRLGDIEGIRYLSNDVNLGFLRSCNRAAGVAKGHYIYMLNNDTELRGGAIDALVDLLEARPDAGMAGSKLLFPDGRLQEAGGILWSDASGWNYGRGEDPSRPEYNYVREVDYCSGASIMIRRWLFEDLGGFDEHFAPAYYEDSDLAFRVRAHGLKVLYEPRSEVVHHEGMSHGTDTNVGVKAHQVTNQARMLERWKDVLAHENYPSGEHVLRARDRARGRKVAMVIDHYVPEPDRDAGSRSTMGIVDSLVDAGWVVKFWPQNRAYSPTYTCLLERRGIEVVDGRWPGDLTAWTGQFGHELDHLLIIRPSVATDVLQQLIWNTDAVMSFYGVDLHFARMRRQAIQEDNPGLVDDAVQMEQLERRVWRHFDVVIYPSEEEAAVVRTMAPTTLARGIVPFCFDPFPARTAPTEGRTILFVAGFAHPPNVDAAVYLIEEIVPRLEQAIGPVKVVLAGSNPTETVRALAGARVEVTGYVTDEVLAKLYEVHRVSVVPLRFGAGVKGKVVEALSHGLPLVTTSIGAQGIAGLSGVVPVCDDVASFAAALGLLLTDDAAWMAQSVAQMEFAQRCFSRAAMQQSVLSALADGEAARRNETSEAA